MDWIPAIKKVWGLKKGVLRYYDCIDDLDRFNSGQAFRTSQSINQHLSVVSTSLGLRSPFSEYGVKQKPPSHARATCITTT